MATSEPTMAHLLAGVLQPLARAQIRKDYHFSARSGEVERAHVRILVGAIHNSGKLDPVLVWRSPDADNGMFTLLDGAHRLAAYKAAKWRGGIPARVVSCDYRTALLLAAGANSKDTLPLTNSEKWDMAWRLVMEPEVGFSKAEIAGATGVSNRTVANMRGRWRTMKAAKQEPTGSWRRDRTDTVWDAEEPPSDAQRKKEIEVMAKAVLAAVKGKQKHDDSFVADVLQAAFGYRLRHYADHLFGDVDEWGNIHIDADYDDIEDDEEPAF